MTLTDKQLIEEIKKGQFKPVYLLQGDVDHYIDVISDCFEKEVVAEEMRDFDLSVVYGRDVTMNMVVGLAQQYPLMSPMRVVIVKEAQNIAMSEWDDLVAYLKKPSAKSVLVLCYRHKTVDKRALAYKAIAAAGVVYETPKIYDSQVPDWIKKEVVNHGFTITDKAAALIAESVGNDLGKIVNELSKLYTLLSQGGCIDETLVEEQVGISKDYNAFELQKAIGMRNVELCTKIVNHMAANPKKYPIQPILALLYGYYLKVMYYHQLENKSDAAKVLGIAPSFVREYAQAASNYSLGKLATCIGYLHEADLRSKGVRNSGDVTDGELLKELVFKTIY